MSDPTFKPSMVGGGPSKHPHLGWVILGLIFTFIAIIGGINWFSVSVAKYDLVVHMCKQQDKKGTAGTCPRVIYGIVGVCSILLLIMVIVGLAMYKHLKQN